MFQIGVIAKYLKRGGAAAAALLLLLAPLTAFAAGESYYWTSGSNQTITGTGGGYQKSVTLTESAQNTSTVSFTGTTTLTCNSQPTQVTIEADIAAADYQQTYPTPAVITASPDCPDANLDVTTTIAANATSATPTTAATQSGECDQGSFSWLVCPLMSKISDAVSTVATDALTPLLQVKPLSATATPGLYQAWDNVKNLAEIIFVIVFMVAILSTAVSFGLDQYTVKRLLPRLVAAAILIQFSFFICAFIVDAGNVLGGGIQDLILTNLQTSAMQPAQNILGNLTAITSILAVGGIAIWASFALAGPVLLMLLLSTIAFLLTLAARYLIIAVLVAVAPLAVVAWVLPNTASYFKKWATLFVRLILMYPIILGLLAIGERVNEIFGFTSQATTNGFTNTLTDILKPLIIVVLFMAIPRTFKWAGGMMTTAHSTFSGLASSSNKKIRGSDLYKDRNAQRRQRQHDAMDTLMKSNAITSLSSSNSRLGRGTAKGFLTGAGWAMGTTASNALAHERTLTKGQTDYAKELDDLGASPLGLRDVLTSHYSANATDRTQARRRLLANYPELEKYTRSTAGRMAAIQQLEGLGILDTGLMGQISTTAPNEYGAALRAARRSFSKNPTTLSRYSEGEVDSNFKARQAGEFKIDPFKAVVHGLSTAKLRDDFSLQNFKDATQDTVIAQAMAESANATIFASIFGGPGLADVAKRDALIDMIASQRAVFRTGNGALVKDDIINRVVAMDETYARELATRLGGKAAPGPGAPISQVKLTIEMALS